MYINMCYENTLYHYATWNMSIILEWTVNLNEQIYAGLLEYQIPNIEHPIL